MKTRITILAIIFILFDIVSSDAFDKKNKRIQTPKQYTERGHNYQFPPGIKDMKDIESREIGFIKKSDKLQSNTDSLVESVMIYKINGYNEKYTYAYNENKQILTEIKNYWANDEWYVSSRVNYTYNEDGNLSTKLQKNGMNEENYERHTLTYNEDGRRRTYLKENWKNEEWVNYFICTYSYDEDGNLFIFLWKDWENEEWMNNFRSTYIYDEDGNLITRLEERWKNDEWVKFSRYIYSYDEDGNLITLLEDKWENEEWMNNFRSTYSYDENGNLITLLGEILWKNDEWGNAFRYTYTYDDNGNILTCIFESWHNNREWLEFEYLLYFEDSNGNYYSFQAYKIEVKWKNITSVESKSIDNFSITTFPNPFTNSTTIEYTLDKPAFVRIKLYNLLGIEVAGYGNEFMQGGWHTLIVNGSELADGVYILRLESAGKAATKTIHKMK